jgi:methyl-accepting chemotaxis protein
LREIIQMSIEVGDVIGEITSAANQQSEATQHVNTSMVQISDLVHESAVAADETANACNDLSNLALDLRGLVNQFKLDSGPEEPRRATRTGLSAGPDRSLRSNKRAAATAAGAS